MSNPNIKTKLPFSLLSPHVVAATMKDIGITDAKAHESLATVLMVWSALSGALGNGYIKEEMSYSPRARAERLRIQQGTRVGLKNGADRARGGNPRSGHPGNGYRRW